MKPGLLGGTPAFPTLLAWVRPTLPRLDEIAAPLEAALASGQLTNGGPHAQAFEARLEEYLGAHCVCVASGTAGLQLAAAALLRPGRRVLVPAFTFPATGLAFATLGHTLVLGDIHARNWCLEPDEARRVPAEADVLVPVNVYGHPPDVARFEQAAGRAGCVLIFDSAHGMGSAAGGRRVGSFGHAEVFSLHTTKLLGCGEGGVVATRDEALARELRLRRNFGLLDNVSRVAGSNAKMQEFSALLGLWGLPRIEGWIERRARLAALYAERLAGLPGLVLQQPAEGVRATHLNLALRVEAEFGLERDELQAALRADNVLARAYFWPDLGAHPSLAGALASPAAPRPPRAAALAQRVLCLPLYSHQDEDEVRAVCECLARIHDHAPSVRARLERLSAGPAGAGEGAVR